MAWDLAAARADRPLDLYAGPVTAHWLASDLTEDTTGQFALHWMPTPSVGFRLAADARDDRRNARAGPLELRLPSLDGSLRGFVREHYVDSPDRYESGSLAGRVTSPFGWLEGGELGGGSTSSVEFGVLNFPAVMAAEWSGDQVVRAVAHDNAFQLALGEWEVTLTPREHRDAWGAAPNRATTAITHLGEAHRADGSEFSIDSAKKVLAALRVLLTFARGERTAPALARSSPAPASWSDWTIPPIDPLYVLNLPDDGWLGMDQLGTLQAVAPAFMTRWSDEVWTEALDLAVSLRADAAARSEDTGLVIAMQALEHLAWAIVIQDQAALSREGFDRLTAADRLRLALTTYGLSRELPKSFAAMPEASDFHDAPHALTEIRNRLVHPSKATKLSHRTRAAMGDWRELALDTIDALVVTTLSDAAENDHERIE